MMIMIQKSQIWEKRQHMQNVEVYNKYRNY